jgi:hypothetical protein
MNDPEMGETPDNENAQKDESETGNQSDDTYYLPAGAVPEGVKVGDTIKFQVENVSDDGEVEVKCLHGNGEGDGMNWRDELKKNVKDY